MTRRRLLLAALAVAVACTPRPETPAPPAAEVRAEGDGLELVARLGRDRLPITDTVTVRVEAIVDESRQVEFPDSLGSPEEFGAGPSDVTAPRLLDDGRVAYERVYELEAYVPGEFPIGPIEVEHWPKGSPSERESVTVDGLSVTVDSVLLTAEDEAELRDIRDPVEAPIPWWWWALASAVAAALGLAAYLWWKRRRPQKAEEQAAPPPPPHVAALAALDELLAEGLVERGEYKLFYGLISNILRRYIEDRFGLHAPERTTEEFLNELRGGQALGAAHQGLLKMFLEHSDLVKFAEMQPGAEDVERSVALCRRFIEETALRGVEMGDQA